jgi:hypothetical protein
MVSEGTTPKQVRQSRGGVQVMEHRELPRIGTADRRPETVAEDAVIPTHLLKLKWRKPSRTMGYRRFILGLTVVLGLLGLGLLALGSGLSWLTRQTPYQIPFKSIQLVSAPPNWFRGGASAFLENVRQRAEETETLPILELTPDRVKLAFLQSPWVESVVRVSYPPRGLRVELQYCEPVALVKIPGDKEYLLDESGKILPQEDVDRDRLKQLGPVIVIYGEHLTGPLDPKPGEQWKPKPAVNDLAEGNIRIPDAVKLASFLVRQIRALGASRPAALDIVEINPMDPASRGLFVFNREMTCILWGEAPGGERRGSLSAKEKWAALRDWSARTKDRSLPGGDYWAFSKNGLVHVPTLPAPRDRSSHPSSHQESHSSR